MKPAILVLGGTAEAIKETEKIIAQSKNHRIIYSLAGRTNTEPKIDCEVRVGGFGGIDGLADFIKENGVTEIVDATHPFATQISHNSKIAAEKKSIKLTTVVRPRWKPVDGDNWISVSSIESAVKKIPKNANVFLALGSQYIEPFTMREDSHFVIRMVDEPASKLDFKSHQIITGKPGATIEEEVDVLTQNKIDIIVSRNSGGEKSYTKIAAARLLGLPVIMIERPD